ncbi:MAG: RdgB/HAM1 family non-canonical purine NTP pyrophosphatase [Ectothiorhodospiraceae bacterium]
MTRVVFASNNAGKVAEIDAMLAPTGYRVLPQSEWLVPEAEETAPTFVENALIKARHACAHTGLPAIADDSGLEVDALGGEPGIHSARYAGHHGDDAANNSLVLAELADTPEAERTARFRCVLVYLRHADDPAPVICQGVWEGLILRAERGAGGFGYDPLFWVPDQGCSAAELPAETKNRLSHRGQALRGLVEALAAP